jgi:P4 family phage/plasmid primase-like protien
MPPGAELSPLSKVKPESAGKAPGKKNAQGRWVGYGWQSDECTEADAAQMDADKANIGIKAGSFPGVDIDCTDEAISVMIEKLALTHLGPAPVRVGQAPKRLLMYKTDVPFGRMRLWFRVAEKQHLIEVLGEGQQYVVSGIHPRTQKAYRWTWGSHERAYPIVKPAKLTSITKDAVAAFLVAVEEELDLFDITCQREGSGNLADKRTTPQESLKSKDLEQLANAVALIPNDTPSRDEYIKMGYAIKAASQDDEGRGYEIFLDWAQKWEGGTNDPFTVKGDWDRMHPPYEVGADWLYDQASQHGFNSATTEFEAYDHEEEEEEDLLAAEMSDIWVSEQFLEKYGQTVKWIPAWGKWLVWDGHCWRKDNMLKVPGLVIGTCKEVADRLLRQGSNEREKNANLKKAIAVSSARTVQAVQSLLKNNGDIVANAEMMDADPWVLGTPGGTVDLKTGEILASEPMRFVSKLTAVTPIYRQNAPIWKAFLKEATAGDVELEKYLQRLAGYCLTGLVSEHNLAFLWGPGGNGKSVFINTVSGILGEYAKIAPMETFTASFGDRHPTELAGLQGARLVSASETQEGRAWDEAKVKAITGGDMISARYMHQDFFQYAPTFKLVFLGNHKPEIKNLDDAMRRRFHLVPFTVKPKSVDKQLFDRLKNEWPAVLAWMIEGCLSWQLDGLMPPQAVLAATAEYFDDEDPVGRWLSERSNEEEEGFCLGTDLYSDWEEWCGENGEKPGNSKRLTQSLISRGFERYRQPGTGRRGFKGLVLKEHNILKHL